jgi:hypothetical protein
MTMEKKQMATVEEVWSALGELEAKPTKTRSNS